MTVDPRQLIHHEAYPIYWFYNVNEEQKWNVTSVFPSVTDLQQLELVKQQEQQLFYIANHEDTVLFRYQPENDFLDYLTDEGITLPHIKIVNPDNIFEGLDVRDALFVPYIISEEVDHWKDNIPELKVFGSDHDVVKQINNKFTTRQLAENHDFQVTKGFFCKNMDELQQAYKTLRSMGFEKCVLKIPYGSSGKGLRVIESENSFQMLVRFISRRNTAFDLLIEGWHPVRQNINCQLWVDKERIEILAITEQSIDSNGVYLGTNYTPKYDPMMLDQYRQEMLRLGRILRLQGYLGICGIDSIIDLEDRLFPIIEINARFTHVTYLLPLVNKFSNRYKHITTRYVRFESAREIGFHHIYNSLQQVLSPDDGNRFMIYTFAKFTLPDESKTIYRVYVMFYGNHPEKMQSMACAMEGFKILK